MSVFNNITYSLTDAEKFALICGMLLGLRLQDKTQPAQTIEQLMQPVSINSSPSIGIKVGSVACDGNTGIRVPIGIHDANIGYSGFTFFLKYPTNLMTVDSISVGTFGELTDYFIDTEAGEVYCYSLLDASHVWTQPTILCYLNITLKSTSGWLNIPLNLESGTGYDPNFCTLLRYEDGNLFYITPLSNVDGKIINNTGGTSRTAMPTEEMTESLLPALQDSGRGATASPAMIALGTQVIGSADRAQAVIPIYLNSTENVFEYNKFILRTTISKDYSDYASFNYAAGIDGWSFEYTITVDEDLTQHLEIVGTRTSTVSGNCTAGYICVAATGDSSLNVIVHNDFSQLINTSTGDTLDVLCGDGRVCVKETLYYAPEEGSGTTGWGSGVGAGSIATVPQGETPSEADTNPTQQMSGSTGGGTEMSGQIYTDTEQIIEIDMGDGNKSFVYLEPGWNDIHVIIPSIYGKTKWVSNLTPKITSTGYTLIPVGFSFRTFNNRAVRKGLSSPNYYDKLKFEDLFDVFKEEKPKNTDIEEYSLEDFAALTKIEIEQKAKELLDEFEIADDYEIVIEKPVEPITADDIRDELEIEDFTASTKQEIKQKAQELCEEYGIDEVLDVLVYRPPVPITADDIRDEVEVEDLTDSTKKTVTIDSKEDKDTMTISDLLDIE